MVSLIRCWSDLTSSQHFTISILKKWNLIIETKASSVKFPKMYTLKERGKIVISAMEFLPAKLLTAPIAFPVKIWLAVKLS